MTSLICILLVMLFFSAFFSGSEMAYLSSNRLDLEINRKKQPRSARIIDIFTADSSTLIATILVGNNIALVIYGLMFDRLMQPVISEHITSSDSLSLLIQTVLSTIVIIIAGEFIPITIIQINPSRMLSLLAMPLMFFYIIFYPIARGMQACAHFFITKILRKPVDDDNANILPSRIDLDNFLTNQSENTNNTESEVAQEAKLMKNALDFGKIKVRDCAIPRTEIEAVDITDSIEELNNTFIRTGYSKILVYEESIDNIIGYVHASSMFKNPTDIRSIMYPIAVVPETMEAKMLFKRFTGEHKSIALVVDEFGGTAGMVTLEDVLEEICGEINDEHDTPDYIEKVCAEGEYIFSGRLEIDYLNDKYNLNLPTSDDYDTIAGLILSITESIPAQEETIDAQDFEFKILVATQARIETVKLTKKS